MKFTKVSYAQIQGPRNYQQDRYLIKKNLLAVADGMGGHKNGDLAAQEIVDQLNEIDDVSEALEKANFNCYKSNDGRGSTVVVCTIKDDMLHVDQCGDSRVYLYFENTLKQLTKDQGYGHILHNFVGDYLYLGLHKKVGISPGNIVLLTTDGIHDYLDHEKMLEIVSSLKDSPEKISEALIEACRDKTQDNCTIVCARIE